MELIAKDSYLRNHHATGSIVEDCTCRPNLISPMFLVSVSRSGRQNHFWGLDKSFYTLLQFVTLDDIADVYYPLILEKPYLGGFFFPILIFISIGLMNLVTASLVENAMQTAAIEAEEERLKLKKKVKGVTQSRSSLRVGLKSPHDIA